jgi:hypothetical protein
MKYDIPSFAGSPSPALKQFLSHWFKDSFALTRGDVDLSFVSELSDHEREYACDLLRRNLSLRYTHIIQGLGVLQDTSAVPVLSRMLTEEENLSRRLTIAGTLWRLGRDEAFFDVLAEMKASGDAILIQAHIDQVLWLADERAIDLLCEFLDHSDSFVRFLALSRLNEVEFGDTFTMQRADDLIRQPKYYRKRRYETALRRQMVDNLSKILGRRLRFL